MKQPINLNSEFEPSVEALKQLQPNEEQYQSMQENLDQVVAQQAARQAQSKSTEANGLLNSLLQMIQRFQFPKVLAGSAAMITVAMTGLLMVTTTSSPAFAKVVEHFNNIHSMTYSSELISDGKKLMSYNVFYQAPSHVRVETFPANGKQNEPSMINVIDADAGQGLILMPSAKIASPFQFEPRNDNTNITENPLQWFNVVRDFDGDAETLEPVLINGQYAQGYVIKKNGMLITLWANVETNIPVKFSLQSVDKTSVNVFEMEAEITFNESLNQSLFSLDVPENYNITTTD